MSETYETLNEKTVAELRGIVRSRGIVGFSKKRKEDTIKAILSDMDNTTSNTTTSSIGKSASTKTESPVTAVKFELESILTKPNAKTGDKTTTTIKVQSGANQKEFPVVGKTVAAVQSFLKEVLNIDSLADGYVGGNKVSSTYVLKAGDVLEYIKPAGRKG